MRIRPATRADLRVLAAIEDDADWLYVERFGATDWEPAHEGEERAAHPGFLLVAEEDEAVVGFAHVLEVDGAAHLEQVSVRTDRQQRGIGRTLVEAVKAEAASRGHGVLTLMTYADVPWNAPFYARCGFVEVEPTTRFHRRLRDVERDLGLARHGRRLLMAATLTPDEVTGR